MSFGGRHAAFVQMRLKMVAATLHPVFKLHVHKDRCDVALFKCRTPSNYLYIFPLLLFLLLLFFSIVFWYVNVCFLMPVKLIWIELNWIQSFWINVSDTVNIWNRRDNKSMPTRYMLNAGHGCVQAGSWLSLQECAVCNVKFHGRGRAPIPTGAGFMKKRTDVYFWHVYNKKERKETMAVRGW